MSRSRSAKIFFPGRRAGAGQVRGRHTGRILAAAAGAFALLIAPGAHAVADGAQQISMAQRGQASGNCYDGYIPLNPELPSCSLPSAHTRVPGAAPSSVAIIACRNHPGCLSDYVNQPN